MYFTLQYIRLRACLKKGFLQDVRHNLQDICPDEGAVVGYGN